jgi:glyoxylase-like metal-dependent hydrolase (beta-lactamase superfamily II)
MLDIAKGIYQLTLPIPDSSLELNCYLIEGKDGWLLIDTGWYTAEAFSCLQKGLKDIGLALTDISTIVVTHTHPDHFGLAGKIKQASPKTKLLAHIWESALIDSLYVNFTDLRSKSSAMLKLHGIPATDLSALESATMPAIHLT